ncbi:MAG: RraA family protein [Tumebacillaceae bacterium]
MNLAEKFANIPTTCLSDAMQGMNNLNPSIKPLDENMTVVGRAFTVKLPVGDNLLFLKAIREAQPGDVLVVDVKGDTYRAMAGDFILGMAQTLGIAGVVVDGVIRDVRGCKALNFPVFCKGTTVAPCGKAGIGELNVPISCGGVSVQPGDLIVGDADGVVVIPQAIENEVLEKAKERLALDEQRVAQVAGNREEILRYIDKMLSK